MDTTVESQELETLDDLIQSGDATLIPEQGIVVSLNTGKEIKPQRKRQGRPLVHPFPGRVTLTLDERSMVLEDTDAFIALMNRAHTVSDSRLNQLYDEGLLLHGVDEINYTFKGPIRTVIAEVKAKMEQYKGTALGLQVNFHKVKMISNPGHPLYLEPVCQIDGKRKRVAELECNPNMLYGYLTVMVPRET